MLIGRSHKILFFLHDFIIDKNYIAWEYDIFEEVTDESMPKKLSPEVDIYVFTKIYSPSEFKDVDYDIEKPKANLPKIDSDYNIPKNEDKTTASIASSLSFEFSFIT